MESHADDYPAKQPYWQLMSILIFLMTILTILTIRSILIDIVSNQKTIVTIQMEHPDNHPNNQWPISQEKNLIKILEKSHWEKSHRYWRNISYKPPFVWYPHCYMRLISQSEKNLIKIRGKTHWEKSPKYLRKIPHR